MPINRTASPRWMAGAALLAAATAVFVPVLSATAQASGRHAAPVVNPYSPAYHHPYRHGVVPTIQGNAQMRHWARTHLQAPAAHDLNYGGGIGVTAGHEKVYLVFYGSQWGTQGTDATGDVTLSGDPSNIAPYLQELMKGLGTGHELWSGVMTQYCDGTATGSQSCPASNTAHVAYPTGGALAGVWVDESAASPQRATGHQLGTEAVHAATHFGNTTAAANRDAQYVIVSPHGTDPDRWLTSGFCAWHDDSGDSTLPGGLVTSPYGAIAFTNLPYIPDAGASCGSNFVNSNGPLDGVSITEGHEYAETITDQTPEDGWTDAGSNETGDKCSWINPGTPGGSFDLSLTTGTFAMQTTWANDGNGGNGACEGSHPIVANPPATGPVFGIYGKCVDVRGANPANGTPVQIFTCNGPAAQQWTITPGTTGDTLHALGKCLNVQGAGTANHTPVQIFTCNGTAAQVWVPFNGELINPHSGRCLDDPSGSSTNRTPLQIYDCHQNASQTWELPGHQPSVTGPVYGIYGKCADMRGANHANGTPVRIVACNGMIAQQWTVKPGTTGDTLHTLGKCLDVQGAGTANHTPVQIYTCNGTVAQIWVPLHGELINPHSGRCLDDPNSSSTNGTPLQIYDCHQSANQTWELPS